MTDHDDHDLIADRFADADLERDRFVAVQDGGKACFDHDTRHSDPRDGKHGAVSIYRGRPEDAPDVEDTREVAA